MPRLSLFCLFAALVCFGLAFYFGLTLPGQTNWPPTEIVPETGMISGFWYCLFKGMFFLWFGYVFGSSPERGFVR